MTPEAWEAANDTFLSKALTWLRLRLELHAEAPLLLEPNRSPPRATGWWPKLHQPTAAVAPAAASSALAGSSVAGAAQVADARAEMQSLASASPPPALSILRQRLGLSSFESDLLFLCAALELDTRIAHLCAQAQGDASRPYPTFALAATLFDEPAWDVLSPHRPLRYWHLVDIHQTAAQPLTTGTLRADERIVSYLKGLNFLDDRLAPLLTALDTPDDGELPPSQSAIVDDVVQRLQGISPGRRVPVIQLIGADTASKGLLATRIAESLGLVSYRVLAALLPAAAAELDRFTRLWQRETLLMPLALYIDAHEIDAANDAGSVVTRFLARSRGVVFLDVREQFPDVLPETMAIDVHKPTAAEQAQAWKALLGSDADEAVSSLVGQFDLGVPAIHRVAAAASAVAGNGDGPPAADLWSACLQHTRPRLDTLAQRLVPKATWASLVLPPGETELLQTIVAQVRHRRTVYGDWGFGRRMNRGLGISVLFAGESGTGKTMAAEVIANDLQLDLYRIDLSAVVSKYIGETEKNLRRLFDAADDGGAILFFDEADALFGKRSEVKDSHDRYANIEINYLLQRIEAYRGLAILASNIKAALDTAFLRRLRFIVNFPHPGPLERRRMWEGAFPAEVPLGPLDYERLARLNLTGGSIHNIALNAAFLAAHAKAPVSMALVLNAARAELRKLERPLNETELRHLGSAGGAA